MSIFNIKNSEMSVSFKLDQANGKISDVKIVRMPKDVSSNVQTYYARTKTFTTCEFCNKSVGSKSIYQHKKSQKCLAIQLKKKKEEEKQKKKEEKQKKEEEEKQKKEEEEKQQQQQPEPETRESLTKKIIAMCKQLESMSLMDWKIWSEILINFKWLKALIAILY